MISVFSKVPHVLNLTEVSKWPTGEKEGGREKTCICVHVCLFTSVPKHLLWISYEHKVLKARGGAA